MKKETRKAYEVPALTVVTFKTERGYATSVPAASNNSLGSWFSGGDAWDGGSSGSSDGSSMGGWTDNGGSAW